MEFFNKSLLVCVVLFSVISCFGKVSSESDQSFEDSDITGELAKQANNKENDFIKQLRALRFHLIVKLKDHNDWKISPVASGIKLWSDNKFLITEPTFSKVEGYLKRGDNREAIAAFDSFIRVSAQNSSSTAL